MNKEEAKYPSQQKLLVAIDKLFTKLIRNRNSLMDDKHSEDFQEKLSETSWVSRKGSPFFNVLFV